MGRVGRVGIVGIVGGSEGERRGGKIGGEKKSDTKVVVLPFIAGDEPLRNGSRVSISVNLHKISE